MFSTLVVTCANAMNSNVTTMSTVLSTALANTSIGSTTPVAPETMSPMRPMNTVTGRIDIA